MAETDQIPHAQVKETPVQKLKYLEFVQIVVLHVVIYVSKVYDYAKDNSGPLKTGVQTVEGTVKAVVGPVYQKYHGVPIELLKFFDRKVWAAGFTAAILKKHSSFIEVALFSAFEKLFSSLLYLPSAKEKLTRIISVHMKSPAPYPQLYLYSTADKVIPYTSVESFMDYHRSLGRNVRSFNCGPSPHVDHYRTFPYECLSRLDIFLNACDYGGKSSSSSFVLVRCS